MKQHVLGFPEQAARSAEAMRMVKGMVRLGKKERALERQCVQGCRRNP